MIMLAIAEHDRYHYSLDGIKILNDRKRIKHIILEPEQKGS